MHHFDRKQIPNSLEYIAKILVLELSLVSHACLVTPEYVSWTILAVSPLVDNNQVCCNTLVPSVMLQHLERYAPRSSK